MNYKTYAEAKIANPDSEIYCAMISNDGRGIYGKLIDINMVTKSNYLCNPADYCSSLKEFLDAGFKLVVGDKIQTSKKSIFTITDNNSGFNNKDGSSNTVFILSAAALNGGCKIPAKAEQWTVYNNTLPLCELTDEQAAMLFNAWRKAGSIMCKHYTDEIFVDIKDAKWADKFVYRIKSKSERELFIDKSKLIIGATTDDELVDAVIADLFDAGARYKDPTQHFGENI